MEEVNQNVMIQTGISRLKTTGGVGEGEMLIYCNCNNTLGQRFETFLKEIYLQ